MTRDVMTPSAAGFRMPAEWHRHSRTWMAWPQPNTTFGRWLDDARRDYAGVANAIAEFEPVTMICRADDRPDVARLVSDTVEVMECPIEDAWIRDNGPTFLVDGRGGLAGVDWRFNAWGETVGDGTADDRVASVILEYQGIRRFRAPLILEGGSIHTDGEGTVITTAECLLNPNRNPDLSKPEIEAHILDHLGASKVIWLDRGFDQDETSGHVDVVACFAAPGRMIVAAANDEGDPNRPIFADIEARVADERDARGRAIETVRLPIPPARVNPRSGNRMTLSYINFYIANGGVIVPSFGVPADAVAKAILSEQFPDRTVVAVPANAIAVGGGVIHCITQQQPDPGAA